MRLSIPVKLPIFEGPLDLLLHLIDKNKLNIYDIPIVEITDQYLFYIKKMEEQNLDIMSEFLVMAATLIHIKSKLLLPKITEEKEEEEDPRQELVNRLLEYKKYKHISLDLKERQLDAQRIIFKEPTIPNEVLEYEEKIPVNIIMKDINLSKLYTIFKNVIKKQSDKIDPIRSKFGQIEKEEYSVYDKIEYFKQLLSKNKIVSFKKLIENTNSKQETIATFLAILELMKMGVITINQEQLFDDIIIEKIDITINE